MEIDFLNLHIFPLSITQIDWPTFLREVSNHIGRSPSRTLDSVGEKLGEPAAFLAALGEIRNPGSNPDVLKRYHDDLANHLSFGFLVCGKPSILVELNQLSTGLRSVISIEGTLGIFSGTLRDWRDSIVSGSRPGIEYRGTRFVFNSIYLFLEQAKLIGPFYPWTRKHLDDGTFTWMKAN